jgi:hypothetical protein
MSSNPSERADYFAGSAFSRAVTARRHIRTPYGRSSPSTDQEDDPDRLVAAWSVDLGTVSLIASERHEWEFHRGSEADHTLVPTSEAATAPRASPQE